MSFDLKLGGMDTNGVMFILNGPDYLYMGPAILLLCIRLIGGKEDPDCAITAINKEGMAGEE